MIQIEKEQNIEVLRQVASLLFRENQTLRQRIQSLQSEIARLSGVDTSALQLELTQLQELLAQREKALFGDSSEKRPHASDAKPAGERAAQRGHGPRPQPQLPLIERVHELPVDQGQCPQCGGELKEMGDQSEDSEEISVVERRFVVVRHRRKKYRCCCNAAVVTAPGPRKLIAGGRYSPEFAVEVAASKYLDHLPLERQVRIMDREGLVIDSQTLWNQIDALARHLEPSYVALRQRVLSAPLVHADETYWRLMDGSSSRWWAWCTASMEAVCYRIFSSRSQQAARSVLAGYRGVVMADGYGAYEALARAGPNFTMAHCWAHVRRKFVEAEENYPVPCREVLALIGQLYAVEQLVPRKEDWELPETLASRARLREERSRGLVAQIRGWAEQQKPLPQSGLGKAINYMVGMWPGLTRFLDDARIPLDNNMAERALRGMVVGRKNHYGSRSKRGTEVAALFYSLFESAKLAGVEPKRYVLQATYAALDQPGTVTLPGNPSQPS